METTHESDERLEEPLVPMCNENLNDDALASDALTSDALTGLMFILLASLDLINCSLDTSWIDDLFFSESQDVSMIPEDDIEFPGFLSPLHALLTISESDDNCGLFWGADPYSDTDFASDDDLEDDGERSDLEELCVPGFGAQPGMSRVGIPWKDRAPPTEVQALEALQDLQQILHPQKEVGNSGMRSAKCNLDEWTKTRMLEVEQMLRHYTGESSAVRGNWTRASIQVYSHLSDSRFGPSQSLRERAKRFVLERVVVSNPFGKWTKSKLQPDTEFANDIKTHLLGVGKYVAAKNIVDYLNQPEIQQRHGLKKTISLATAK
jgi:hypothetical protein